MTIYNKRQQQIAGEIEEGTAKSNWQDWRWQLKHSVKDIDTFEKLTGICFNEKERAKIEETIASRTNIDSGRIHRIHGYRHNSIVM